jgi:hypothetical protein
MKNDRDVLIVDTRSERGENKEAKKERFKPLVHNSAYSKAPIFHVEKMKCLLRLVSSGYGEEIA